MLTLSAFRLVTRTIAASASLAGAMSELWPAKGVIFRTVSSDYDLDFHTAPRRQLVVNLQGSVEIEVGDGSVRRLDGGDILLAEDTTGRGHKSRNVDGQPRTCRYPVHASPFR